MGGHTLGPWLREDLTVYALEDVPEKRVRGEPAKRNRFWANVHGNAPREELEAVARKMHAAPDLLEALKALMAWSEHPALTKLPWGAPVPESVPSFGATVKMVFAAIAKAEGK